MSTFSSNSFLISSRWRRSLSFKIAISSLSLDACSPSWAVSAAMDLRKAADQRPDHREDADWSPLICSF